MTQEDEHYDSICDALVRDVADAAEDHHDATEPERWLLIETMADEVGVVLCDSIIDRLDAAWKQGAAR